MKLLLLFTLISFACRGQETEIIGDSVPAHIPVTRKLSLEEKLFYYANECYNDSTVKYVHFKLGRVKGKPYGIGYERIIPNQRTSQNHNIQSEYSCNKDFISCTREKFPKHYTRKVTHREPTFSGFIEWIRKKQ